MSTELITQQPLHAPDLEQSVLGAMLVDPRVLEIVLPALKADDFYSPVNALIYNAQVQLFTENITCDELVLAQRLYATPYRGHGNYKTAFEYVGNAVYITGLTKKVVSTVNIREHVLIIKQYSLRRKLAELARRVTEQCSDSTMDIIELIAATSRRLTEINNELQIQKTTSLESTVEYTIKKMIEAASIEGDAIGISCGLKCVDRQTLGFNAPDLIILAGNPGEGKSTLAIQWCVDMAKNGTPVGLVSLEMKGFQLMLKMFSMETGIDVQTLRKGKLSENQWSSVNKSASFISKLKFRFVDKGGLSVTDFKAQAYGWVKSQGVKIIVIDYLQLLTVFGSGKNFTNREQEVNYISKQLKALCMDLDIPIIALSQMSRKEKGAPRKPVMSDLRESGALEQDADGIMFVHRPVYNGILTRPNGSPYLPTDAFLLIEKYRLGRTGGIELNFLGEQSRFTGKGYSPVIMSSNEEFDEGYNAE